MKAPHPRPRARFRRFLLACALVALAAGCRRAEPAPPAVLPPKGEDIAGDLVGTRFVFFENEEGAKDWTIEEGEVRDLRVLDGVTSADGQRHRTRVRLTLAATNRTIRGELDAYYRRQGARWVFEEAASTGRNFAVEELAAVVYAASPVTPGDSTADPRDVYLEPLFRYREGEYVEPLNPYRARVRTLLDSAFATDSLREAAFTALEREVARRYLNPEWTIYLLRPGAPPAPVRARTREASVEGCEYVGGEVRAPTAAFAGGVALATTSSTMGGSAFPGRALAPQEEDALAGLARSRLDALGARADQLERLRVGRTLAVDLDGDGREEWVGAFAIGGDEGGDPERALVLAAAPTTGRAPRLIVERAGAGSEGYAGLALIGAVDVDGDGVLELVLRETSDEVYRYAVLARRRDGSWYEPFAGGGSGC